MIIIRLLILLIVLLFLFWCPGCDETNNYYPPDRPDYDQRDVCPEVYDELQYICDGLIKCHPERHPPKGPPEGCWCACTSWQVDDECDEEG
jgi:hypothetical protein